MGLGDKGSAMYVIPVSVDPVTGAVIGTAGSAGTATNLAGIVLTAATDAVLLAANPARIRAIIRNDSGQPVFVRLGTGAASATQYSLQIPTAASIDLTAGYTGAVHGFSTLAGAAPGVLVTELTA
jgi:hypothetical protein